MHTKGNGAITPERMEPGILLVFIIHYYIYFINLSIVVVILIKFICRSISPFTCNETGMSPNGQEIQEGSKSTRHWCSSEQLWPWRSQNSTQPFAFLGNSWSWSSTRQPKPLVLVPATARLIKRALETLQEALKSHPRGQTSRAEEPHEPCNLWVWSATEGRGFYLWDMLLAKVFFNYWEAKLVTI